LIIGSSPCRSAYLDRPDLSGALVDRDRGELAVALDRQLALFGILTTVIVVLT
jgi:hypothetical protein